MPSRCAVTSLLGYNQCVIYHLVTDDSNFGYFNSLVERLKAIYSFSYCYELNDSRFYLPFSSFGKEENGVTIVYYCLVHSFAVFRNLMIEENNKLKNITMTIMLFL